MFWKTYIKSSYTFVSRMKGANIFIKPVLNEYNALANRNKDKFPVANFFNDDNLLFP